jgi:hypothetical protein
MINSRKHHKVVGEEEIKRRQVCCVAIIAPEKKTLVQIFYSITAGNGSHMQGTQHNGNC